MYDQIVIFPDFAPRTQDNIIYFDNITFNEQGATPGEPSVAAPTPPVRDPDDVISVFSDAYANVPDTDFNPNWGQTTIVSFVEIEGNETMKYANFNYQGTQFDSALDISEMEYMHLDMWTADATSVNVFLISTGPVEAAYPLPITLNEWGGYNIPLTAFAGVDLTDVIQLKFDDGNGAETIYLDNIYFYRDGSAPNEPTVAAPNPPARDPDDVISLFSDAYSNVAVDTWLTPWSVAMLEDITIEGNPTKKYYNLDFAGIETIENQLDLTEMLFLHLDVWSPNFAFFGIKLVDFGPDGAFGGGDDSEHQIDFVDLAIDEWVSLDIPLSDFSGLTSLENIAQYILVGQPTGSSIVYVDNFYFFKGEPLGTTDISTIGNRITIFPNPVNQGGSVQLGLDVKQFELLDLSGRLLISTNASFVDTHKLSKGIYVLRIHTKNGDIQVQKLVVN
jgi:hypothetical protein